jgi:AmmeMemoRadiSam system protein A
MSERYLSGEEEGTLLRIARDSLTAWTLEERRVELGAYALTEPLLEKHGAFVTLRTGEELRGCIGYTRSMEPLCEAVRDNAINAGSRDPRFSPVTEEELGGLHIEISALCPGETVDSPFIRVHDVNELVIGRDGLYLDHAGSRGGGLLLPQVAVDQGWDVAGFLAGVCRKAGAAEDAWEAAGNSLYRFSAQVFGEGGSAA